MASAPQQEVTVHPGDIVQDADGMLMLVTECHSWGVGVVERWRIGPAPYEFKEHYHRLKPGQFVVVGAAHILPPEVAGARRDSLQHAAEVERERQARGQ